MNKQSFKGINSQFKDNQFFENFNKFEKYVYTLKKQGDFSSSNTKSLLRV